MWEFQHTETTTADPARLWARYADPTRWPEWDHETETVTLDGSFSVGSTGTLKPVGGPKTRFRMLEVTENVSFTDESALPLARMRFRHAIVPGPDGGASFTHHITITGPLSPLFARVIGRKVAASLPTAMRRLAELAESDAVRDTKPVADRS